MICYIVLRMIFKNCYILKRQPLRSRQKKIEDPYRMASNVDHNRKSSEGIFQLLKYSRQRLSFSTQRAALTARAELTFPAFSS